MSKKTLSLSDAAEAFTELRDAMLQIAHTLGEINTSNYDHDDVVKLNDKSIEAGQIADEAYSKWRNHEP